MNRPSITIRYGATRNDITVDGQVFEFRKLEPRQRSFLKNVVIDALVKVGTVSRRVAA